MKYVVVKRTYGDFDIPQTLPIAASSNEGLAKDYAQKCTTKAGPKAQGIDSPVAFEVVPVKDLDQKA